MKSEAIKRRLLSEKELTLKKALELAQAMEAADKNAKSFRQIEPLVNRVSTSTSPCHRCGRSNHTANNCKFLNASCHNCGEKKNIAPVCRAPAKDIKAKKSGGRPKPSRTNWMAAADDHPSDSSPGESDLPIYCLKTNKSKPIKVEIQLNGKPLQMEVDTGAALSIISGDTKQKILPQATLQKSQILLQTYTGEKMEVLGELQVDVKYKKQSKSLMLVVVGGSGPSLFGRNWLEQIRLDWKTIGAIAMEHKSPMGIDELCAKYSNVFKEELGMICPFKAHLEIDDRASPRFCKARTVPYSIREAVEQELDRLEAEGTLERVDHSEWETPVVVVPKSDGHYRICGDFKVTLNPVMSIDQYPLPKPQDLYATLSGGKHFTTLACGH